MKNFLLALVLGCSIVSPLKGQHRLSESYERHWESGMQKVKIISYNILNGFDWRKDVDRQVRFVDWVKRQDPEVLSLQELCGFTQESLTELAKQWGHAYAVIVKTDGYPVGITSKKPIELKGKLLENCGHGLLHVRTYGFDVLVTHLNPHDAEKRRHEAETIVQYIKEHSLEHFLLMGDMNSHSPFDADRMEEEASGLLRKYGGDSSKNLLGGNFDYSVISRFLSVPLIDVCQKFVLPSERISYPTPVLMSLSRHKEVRRKIEERLDYILVSPSVFCKVVDACIYNSAENDYLSDHYPVGVDLCVKADIGNAE